jgi:hypothetical protein
MSPHRIRQLIGGVLFVVGAAALLTDRLPEHQAIGIMFFGIAIAIWPKGTGKPKV